MRRASIDPGKCRCAIAQSEGDQIIGVQYTAGSPQIETFELYVEIPVVYPGIRQEDPNDLIRVAIGLGTAKANIRYDRLVELSPRDWKGSLDKDLMLRRIEKLLRPDELALVDRLKLPKKTRHNAIDSMGILLFAMGRLSY